jgi:hypothetical protein
MISTSSSLAERFPEICKEWHPYKNGEITPHDVSYGSGKKVWWICEKGHEWQAVINNRGRGAVRPYCKGRYVDKENNLLKARPDLVLEWHPNKNKKLTPKDLTPFSHTKVWWKCLKGHEWQSTVANRSNARGCPFCSGRKVSVDNNFFAVNPKLASEWHHEKNGQLKPVEVTPGSGKKVWWICEKGHEWQAVIYSRTKGNGCPYCSGKRS